MSSRYELIVETTEYETKLKLRDTNPSMGDHSIKELYIHFNDIMQGGDLGYGSFDFANGVAYYGISDDGTGL